MKFRLVFRETNFGGGKWAWTLYKPMAGTLTGGAVMAFGCGFETKGEAKENWRVFCAGVNNVETSVQRTAKQ